jgi:hypothetical protein
MDNRQSIKPVVNFESLSRVRFNLAGSSSRAVKDAGSPSRDIALDVKLDWRVLTELRVKLEALAAQIFDPWKVSLTPWELGQSVNDLRDVADEVSVETVSRTTAMVDIFPFL